jgi:hypothetical protein
MRALRKPRLDLWTGAVDQHELHAQRRQQVEIVGEIEEAAVRGEIAAKSDDEDLAAERMDVRSDRLEPVDEAVLGRKPLAPRLLRGVRAAVRTGVLFFLGRDVALRKSGQRPIFLPPTVRGYYASFTRS